MQVDCKKAATRPLQDSQWLIWFWFGALFLLTLRPVDDFDTFWQLQSGKYIWESGSFLYHDTFSLARDAFRLEHCWLSDMIFYALYSLGGYTLLGLLKSLVIVTCGAILYRRSVQGRVEPLLSVTVITICLLASSASWVERPQLWTFLFSLIYLKLLFDGRDKGLRSWAWLVPLMLVWANLHAGAVFGLALIGLFGLAELVRIMRKEAEWRSFGLLCGIGLLSFGVAFLNPYGKLIPLQLLAHFNLTRLGAGQASIMEWLPPTTAQVPLFYAMFALWGVLILLRFRRLDPAELIFYAAFCYMGWNQVRHAAFVPLLAGFFLPATLQDAALRFRRCAVHIVRTPLWLSGLVAFSLALLVAFHGARGTLGWGLKPDQFPEKAASFIAARRLPPNLYNFYDWGGYLIWRLYPDYLVFVDGRNTSMEMLNASNRIDNSWPGWREDLERHGVKTVISRTCYDDTGGPVPLVETLSVDPAWALVYADDVAVVFVRREESLRRIWQPLEVPAVNVYRTMQAEAARLYREDSGRTRALVALGRSAMRLGLYGDALKYYTDYKKRFPDDQEARLIVAMLRGRGVR